MNPYPTHNDREVGEFGLSIATDLAVAGSLGRHPDNPLKTRPVDDYDEVWFNLATLVRNAFGAHTTDDQRRLDSQHLIDAVDQDILILRELYPQVLPDSKQVQVRLYHNDYSTIGKELIRARPRTLKTTLQQQTYALQSDAVKTLAEQYSEEILSFRFTLKGSHGKVLLATHYPTDLLSRKYFMELGLLESHTGAVKSKETWYTKFGKDPGLRRIPFDRAMIQIFGDGNTLLAMYPPKIRRKVLEIATLKRWTYMTTREKVVANIRASKEIELLMMINEAYR